MGRNRGTRGSGKEKKAASAAQQPPTTGQSSGGRAPGGRLNLDWTERVWETYAHTVEDYEPMPTRVSQALTLPKESYDVMPKASNTHHGYNYNTPIFAFIVLRSGIPTSQLDELSAACQAIDAVGLKPKTTTAHGGDFHQLWFGLWRRYCGFTFVSSHTLNPKAEAAVEHLTALYDRIMTNRPLDMLKNVDPIAHEKMFQHHRDLTHNFVKGMAEPAAATTNMSKKSAEAVSQGKFSTNSSNRLGGMGTLLTVSRGEGTDFHFDRNDFPAHYTVVFVIGRRAILYFKALNRSVVLKPGAIIYFQSWRLEHKLVWDPTDNSTAFSAVFTAFTCKNAAKTAGLS